jgi:DNA-binding transcriptional ArsR family regulator
MRRLEPLFRALASPARREMLDLLRTQPMTTGDLAAQAKQSRFSVMQHLRVLVSAGLVVPRRRGRERWNYLNAVPLQQMYDRWVRPYEASWADSLVKFGQSVEKEQSMPKPCKYTDVELEIPIAAPQKRVWNSLINDISDWWPRDFFVSDKAKSMLLEPLPGGRLYEDWGVRRGVLWGSVLLIDAPSTLELLCHVTPRFGGPRLSMLRLALTEKNSSTTLALTDSTMGRVDGKTASYLNDGWRAIFAESFKRWVEER